LTTRGLLVVPGLRPNAPKTHRGPLLCCNLAPLALLRRCCWGARPGADHNTRTRARDLEVLRWPCPQGVATKNRANHANDIHQLGKRRARTYACPVTTCRTLIKPFPRSAGLRSDPRDAFQSDDLFEPRSRLHPPWRPGIQARCGRSSALYRHCSVATRRQLLSRIGWRHPSVVVVFDGRLGWVETPRESPLRFAASRSKPQLTRAPTSRAHGTGTLSAFLAPRSVALDTHSIRNER
jgi:hypothetical protein